MHKPSKPEDLDAVIETVLGGEPLRPVPSDFHRRVTARLHVVALLEQEQRRFRHDMTMVGLTVGGILLCMGLFAVLADVPGLLEHGVPGGMGYYDYVATSLRLAWSNFGASLAVVFTSVIAMGLLLTVVSVRWLANARTARRIH